MVKHTPTHYLHRFFEDKDGHIVWWQWPNIPLYGWIIFKVLSFVMTQKHLKSSFDNLSTAFIFAWAYLELMQGINYFRRSLGAIVLIATVAGYFQ